jgi:hypothetical protein
MNALENLSWARIVLVVRSDATRLMLIAFAATSCCAGVGPWESPHRLNSVNVVYSGKQADIETDFVTDFIYSCRLILGSLISGSCRPIAVNVEQARILTEQSWLFCNIFLKYTIYIMGAVYTIIFRKNKIDQTVSTFVYWPLTLHVSTLILGHHQSYKNTSN